MYLLTIDQSGQYIAVTGEERCIDLVSRSPIAIRSGNWAFIPLSRENIFAVEALGSPEVSETYIEARSLFVHETQEDLSATHQLLKDAGWTDELTDYQVEFVCFALRTKGVVNFSEPGTGKTRMNLALASITPFDLCLVVGPAAAAGEWGREYNKTLKDKFNFHYETFTKGTAKQRAQDMIDYALHSGCRVMTYMSFESFARCYKDFEKIPTLMVIVDESWKIKEPTSGISIAIREISKHAKCITLNSGTIIGNEVGDLWNPLTCAKCPGVQETYNEFRDKFCQFVIAQNGPRSFAKPVGVKDPIELMQIASRAWFRVVKSACLDLPPPQFDVVKFSMPKQTREWYDLVKENGETALGFDLSLAGEGTSLLRLQQISGGHLPLSDGYIEDLHTAKSEIGDEPEFDSVNSSLFLLPCKKLEWLEEQALARWLGDPTCRVLIWCRFNAEVRRITQVLAKHFGDRVAAITGETKNIEDIKDSYNSKEPDGVQIMVCQVKRMAFAHNLAATSEAIYFSKSWSYIEQDQSEERGQRPGRIGSIRHTSLEYKNSIDEMISRALKRKEDLNIQLSISSL